MAPNPPSLPSLHPQLAQCFTGTEPPEPPPKAALRAEHPEPPPKAARPRVTEVRTLDDITNSDLTLPTEMAPLSVRSSNSERSHDPSGEPEQEPNKE